MGIPPRLSAAPRRNAVPLRGQIGLRSRSRLSNRRRPRVVPAGGRILRRKAREGRVGGGAFWIFCSPEVWDLPRSSARFLVFCSRFFRCSILVPMLGIYLDWLPFPTFVRGFRQDICMGYSRLLKCSSLCSTFFAKDHCLGFDKMRVAAIFFFSRR